jgi:predicted RNA-binding Zn-ribbon protein involved in translation (DUF1610 family)
MCRIDTDDYERAAVFDLEWRKARKARTCMTCSSALPVGERYLRLFMIADNEATVEVACPPCGEALERFGKEHGFTPTPNSFEALLDECIVGDGGGPWKPVEQGIIGRRLAARAEAARV